MEIIDILKKEKELLFELLKVVEEEKDALVKSDIDNIRSLTKIKEDIKDRIDELEKSRVILCQNMNLKELLSELGEEERKKAESIGKEMEEAVFKIQELNETNNLLIKQSLGYVRMMMSILAPKKTSVYRSSGSLESSSTVSSMLNKSV